MRAKAWALSRAYRAQAPAIFILEVSKITVITEPIRNYRVRARVPVYEELDIEG